MRDLQKQTPYLILTKELILMTLLMVIPEHFDNLNQVIWA